MKAAPPTKTVSVKDAFLAKQVEIQRERIRVENARKKSVFEAICALIEEVDEEKLLKLLPTLDPPSWCEVSEERFLGRLCGYPLCANPIEVDFRKKFTVLRRERRKMIVPTDSEPVKFCSGRCMAQSRAVAAQLEEHAVKRMQMEEEEEGEEERSSVLESRKEFKIPVEEEQWRPFISKEEMKFDLEIVKRLNEFKLADNDGDDGEKREEGEEGGSDSEREEREFMQQIKAFVTCKKGEGPMAGNSGKSETKKGKEEGTENGEMARGAQGGRGWKRGFLIASSSSIVDASQNGKTAKEKMEEKMEMNRGELLVEVVERVNRKMAAEGAKELKGGRAEARKKPMIVEAPKFNAEKAQLART